MNMLLLTLFSCSGGNYIRPNRTALRPYVKRQAWIEKEHDDIIKKTKEHLAKHCPSIPSASILMQQYAQRVRACLTQHYLTPLPMIDQVRARHERDIVLSIRRKLKKAHLVLRESDKGGNLYVGRTSHFAQKAAEYRDENRCLRRTGVESHRRDARPSDASPQRPTHEDQRDQRQTVQRDDAESKQGRTGLHVLQSENTQGAHVTATDHEHHTCEHDGHLEAARSSHSTSLRSACSSETAGRQWPSAPSIGTVCQRGSSQARYTVLHVRHYQSVHDATAG